MSAVSTGRGLESVRTARLALFVCREEQRHDVAAERIGDRHSCTKAGLLTALKPANRLAAQARATGEIGLGKSEDESPKRNRRNV
jgi:hypothetical protein